MLHNIRKFSKTFLAKIVLVIMIIPFVLWGMGGVFNSGNTNNVAKINNKSIEESIWKNGGENLISIKLFDIYNDENNHSFQGQYQYALQHLKNDPVYHQTCYSNLLILPPVFHSSLIFDKNVSFYDGALDADDWGFFIKLFLLNRDRLKIYFIPEILNYVQSPRNNKKKSRNKLFYEWRKNLLLDLIDISSGLKLKRETDIFNAMIIYDHICIYDNI